MGLFFGMASIPVRRSIRLHIYIYKSWCFSESSHKLDHRDNKITYQSRHLLLLRTGCRIKSRMTKTGELIRLQPARCAMFVLVNIVFWDNKTPTLSSHWTKQNKKKQSDKQTDPVCQWNNNKLPTEASTHSGQSNTKSTLVGKDLKHKLHKTFEAHVFVALFILCKVLFYAIKPFDRFDRRKLLVVQSGALNNKFTQAPTYQCVGPILANHVQC